MLMQSALSCDSRKYLSGPLYRALSPTPPPCDGISGLMGVSRKLQTLLNVPPGPASPAPRRSMRLASPFCLDEAKPAKSPLRRSRRTTPKSATPNKPKTPSPQPPRSRHKRSRSIYEDGNSDSETEKAPGRPRNRYSTPKRQKRFPYNMPLGLGISDFEALEEQPISLPHRTIPPPVVTATDEPLPDVVIPSIEVEDTERQQPAAWTAEDDQMLVSVVLNKLKLSKREWEECARQLGKDNTSVGKRWQALVGEGNVGLRRGSGQFVRGRLDGCFDQS
jgi:hypothetical protein